MRVMRNFLFLIFVVLIMFSSCKEERSLKLLKVTENSSSRVSDTSLARIIKIKNDIDISIDYTLSQDFALQQLEDKKVDLVIIPNNVNSNNLNFRTLIPLLPKILVFMTNKDVDSIDISEILERGKVYFEDRSRQDSMIMKKLYYNFNINERKINTRLSEDLKIDEFSDSLKIYAGIVHLNNRLVRSLAERGWHFFSVSDVNHYRKGSRIEGFTMMNTSAYPFIIPMSIYRGKPEKSILTFAINDILICREDLDEHIAYEITQTLIENKSHLIEMNNIYNLLNFDYDSQVLAFPKHRGTEKFLNRDELPVWYKYVKIIWPLISISVVLFGVFASLRQRLKRRKKQNIEMYYNRLLQIRDKGDVAVDAEAFIDILKELKSLRSQATKSLADKKLDPGESFNIFLALYNEVREDITDKIREMRFKEKNN
jgi:TRAP-type uncharacterized transport system substrate-binding protein